MPRNKKKIGLRKEGHGKVKDSNKEGKNQRDVWENEEYRCGNNKIT